MKVSIVTVLMNAEAVVSDALLSIKWQDYSNIEHIIVDGGSTDQTLSLVEKNRIENSIVISEPDEGIYDAMNKGVALATGDALLFLNADDRFAHSSAITALVNGICGVPNTGFAFGDVIVRSPEGDSYRRYSHIDRRNIGFEMVCHQTILARRSVFDTVGAFNTSYKICADLDWLLRCIDRKVSFKYVPEAIAYYAAGGESDKNVALRHRERAAILRNYRSGFQCTTQRLASAIRRRFPNCAR